MKNKARLLMFAISFVGFAAACPRAGAQQPPPPGSGQHGTIDWLQGVSSRFAAAGVTLTIVADPKAGTALDATTLRTNPATVQLVRALDESLKEGGVQGLSEIKIIVSNKATIGPGPRLVERVSLRVGNSLTLYVAGDEPGSDFGAWQLSRAIKGEFPQAEADRPSATASASERQAELERSIRAQTSAGLFDGSTERAARDYGGSPAVTVSKQSAGRPNWFVSTTGGALTSKDTGESGSYGGVFVGRSIGKFLEAQAGLGYGSGGRVDEAIEEDFTYEWPYEWTERYTLTQENRFRFWDIGKLVAKTPGKVSVYAGLGIAAYSRSLTETFVDEYFIDEYDRDGDPVRVYEDIKTDVDSGPTKSGVFAYPNVGVRVGLGRRASVGVDYSRLTALKSDRLAAELRFNIGR